MIYEGVSVDCLHYVFAVRPSNNFIFNEIWICYNKHKLFPTTLKDYALRWLKGLADKAITTWDDMKKKNSQKVSWLLQREECKRRYFDHAIKRGREIGRFQGNIII